MVNDRPSLPKPLTPGEIRALIRKVGEIEADPECAHGLEDDLLYDFVGTIVALGPGGVVSDEMHSAARALLRLVRSDRVRWYS